MLIPGIISPAVTWGFVGERLGGYFDVYVLDGRGRGLSEAGSHLSYKLDDYAADLIAFAEAMGLSDYVFVGHSMGARVAIRAARRCSCSLARLVLLDPPVSGPGRRPYPTPLQSYLDVLRAARMGQAYDVLSLDARRKWPEALLRIRGEWLHTCDENAVLEAYRGFNEDDIHSDLKHIAVPSYLIAADKGDVILQEDEEELRLISKKLNIRRLKDAGHQMHIDNTEEFFRIIKDTITQ